MIWKILSGLFGAITLFILLVWLVPDLRRWAKTQAGANQELTDSLKTNRQQLAKVKTDLAQKDESLKRIQQDLQRSEDKSSSIVPNVKLDVSKLSAMAQRLAILESLIKQGLLKPADTSKVTSVVTYNEPSQTALSIQLRICDSLRIYSMYRDRAYAAEKEVNRLRGDSIKKVIIYFSEGKAIARKKGWFTGKNKDLRDHALHPPI